MSRASPAKVDIDEPTGSDSLVRLGIAGHSVSLRAVAGHGFRSGREVRRAPGITTASLFDKQTELRL